jgi:anti-sigma regulatory factor (Ser/Thr protein kinase)
MPADADLPEGDVSWVIDLRGTSPSALARVRGWAADTLAHLGEEHLLDVLVVVDELASNAYEHAEGPSWARLTALSDPCLVVIEVDDTARVRPTVRHPDVAELRGRGMQLVDQLADQWGVHENVDGKTVWARLVCDSPARAACGGPRLK